MDIDTPSREMLLRYLLNEIDEHQRETIDTLLIVDPEYHAAFQELEYDLRDALTAGELAPQEATRAKNALQLIDSLPTGRQTPTLPGPVLVIPSTTIAVDASRRRLASRLPPVWIAVAAVVLIAATAGTKSLLSHKASPPAATPSIRTATVDSQPTKSPTPPLLPLDPASPPSPKASSPRPRHAAILLLPGATRSSSTLSLPIPHGATVVRIDWPSPEQDTEKPLAYQLQILNDAGTIYCTTPGIPQRGVETPIVHFLCPVRDVPSGVDFIRIASLPPDPDLPFLLEVTVSVERQQI